MTAESSKAIAVFYSYAHKDESLRKQLEIHLSTLKRQGLISAWYDRNISVGTEWANEIKMHLERAHIILLLISPDFIASNYCYGIEMTRALERHDAGEACVIPIILRPTDWQKTPFSKLQVLPIDGKPVTKWQDRDDAFLDITEGIRKAIEELAPPSPGGSPGSSLVWNVPHRYNPYFTGREDVLKRMHETLTTKEATALTQPQAISGLGGIGKTQTAVEYAYRYRDEYRYIFWVRANTLEELASDFAAIASLLNLHEQNAQNQSVTVSAIKGWLEAHTDWLLILDDVEDLEMVGNFIPRQGKGHVLLTTRTQAVRPLAQPVEIEKMEAEEGALFLLHRLGVIAQDAPLGNASANDQAKAREIVLEMDGLPLALDQAGAYIEETQCGLSSYLDIYRQRRTDLLKRRGGGLSPDHPLPVASTWSLSFQRIEAANPAAADMLRLCAFLASDTIPEQLFVVGAQELGPHFQSRIKDEASLNEAIGILLRFSLVKRRRDQHLLYMHRLVQTVLRINMDSDVQRLWIERTVRALNRAFPNVEFTKWLQCQQYLPHVLACLPSIQNDNLTFLEATQLLNKAGNYLGERAHYALAEELSQQAKTIRESTLDQEQLDLAESIRNLAVIYHRQGEYNRAEQMYEKALTIRRTMLKPELSAIATSLNDLSKFYYDLGEYTRAEVLCRQALQIRQDTLGAEHASTATSLNALAKIYYRQGKYEEAESFYQQALAIREKVLNPQDPDIAQSLDDLARLYYSLGKYPEAEPLYQRALEIRVESLGPHHPDTATIFNDLARLYYREGKYPEAESLYRRAQEVWKSILGPAPQHPDVAASLNNLAKLYYREGEYPEAERLYQQVLQIWKKVLGTEPQHPEFATSLNDLARLYYKQGKYAQAEPLYQQSLNIRRTVLGANHSDVAESLNNLASLYYKQGKYKEAEPLYQQALKIREKSLGSQHLDVAETFNNLGRLYYRQGRYPEAEQLYQQALAIREKVLGPEHPDAAETFNNLAKLYYKQGKYVQAKKFYQYARKVWKKVLGPAQKHPDVALILNNLARLYTDLGKYDQAERFYKQALEMREFLFGLEALDTASSLNDLAGLYCKQGKYAEAESLCLHALKIRKKALGKDHPYVAQSLNDLANLYYEQGKYEKAEEYFQQALTIRKKVFGAEHPDVAEILNDLGRLYYRQGRYAEAEEYFRQALTSYENALGQENSHIATVLDDLAILYTRQGKYAQAEPPYQRALAVKEKVLGAKHPDTLLTLNNYVTFLRETHRESEVATLESRIVAMED